MLTHIDVDATSCKSECFQILIL